MNDPSPPQDFDFDRWMQLAREDPDAFAQRRKEAIEDFFARLPPSERPALRHLQWRIDMEIRRSRSPMGACIRLHQLLMDSLQHQQALLSALLENRPLPSPPSARVIPFSGRRQS